MEKEVAEVADDESELDIEVLRERLAESLGVLDKDPLLSSACHSKNDDAPRARIEVQEDLPSNSQLVGLDQSWITAMGTNGNDRNDRSDGSVGNDENDKNDKNDRKDGKTIPGTYDGVLDFYRGSGDLAERWRRTWLDFSLRVFL